MIYIIAILIIVFYCFMSFRAEPLPKDKVRFFAGTMGSGKSFLSVYCTVVKYKTALLLWRIKVLKSKPHFYANIPIQLRKLKKHEKQYLTNYCGRKIRKVDDVAYFYSDTGENLRPLLERWGVLNEWLLKEHITWKILLPKNSCVFIDELSLIADQYSHDIPEVREQLVFFIGFCRHWFLGKHCILAANAQATDQIVKQVRTKFGVGVILSNFHRVGLVLPWYKVNCYETINIDDVRILDGKREEKKYKPYYFGYLGYFTRYYNSHCYEPAYADKFCHKPDFLPKLQTRYIIDLQCSEEEMKEYKKNRDKYRAALFVD